MAGAVGTSETGREQAVERPPLGGLIAGRGTAHRRGFDGEPPIVIDHIEPGRERIERAFQGERKTTGRSGHRTRQRGAGRRLLRRERMKAALMQQPGARTAREEDRVRRQIGIRAKRCGVNRGGIFASKRHARMSGEPRQQREKCRPIERGDARKPAVRQSADLLQRRLIRG